MKTIKDINLDDVKKVLFDKGYDMFSGFVPNIVGIRNTIKESNAFDDRAFAWWQENGVEESHDYTITTNPGYYYLQNPIAGTKGTAILVPGQYKDCWELGMHRGKQFALCQRLGQVRVYRDADKDKALDMDPKTIDTGFFGIDLHNAGVNDPVVVDQWSAGCQVWEYHEAHQKLMHKIEQLGKGGGFDRYSYTLLTQEDFA